MDFKDPPLVERSSLPENLRPENRRFGKIAHFFGKIGLGYNAQVPSYRPTGSESGIGRNRNSMYGHTNS